MKLRRAVAIIKENVWEGEEKAGERKHGTYMGAFSELIGRHMIIGYSNCIGDFMYY